MIPDVAGITTAAGVDELLRNRTAGIKKWNTDPASLHPYWMHAVPLRVFFDFILCTPPQALLHESCDFRLTNFLRDHTSLPLVFIESSFWDIFWMYFHRQHHEGRVCASSLWVEANVDEQDAENAKRVRDSLRQSYDKQWALLGKLKLPNLLIKSYIKLFRNFVKTPIVNPL